jgi:hypothetical protein
MDQNDGGILDGGIEGEAGADEKTDECTEEHVHPIG